MRKPRKKKEHWLYKADISWVANHPKMTDAEKADKIWYFLHRLKPFTSKTHRTVLTELVTASKIGRKDFEDKLEVLYNFCDYYRIWLSV